MAKRFIWLFLAVLILLLVVPNVLAGSSSVISEGKAGGYKYLITKEGNEYTWTLEHKGNKSVFEETEENRKELNNFKQAIIDIKNQSIKVCVFIIIFFIFIVFEVLLHMKNKLRFKDGGAIIFLLAVIAIGQIFVALTELDSAFSDARFYYYRILK
ncbi:competence protein ComGC [Bacillus sp. SORGH_AS 510]|uniref:hypothetical protein n=1 Tax=Bacillus sp. SORGH_AS_0510 TaxID=3041771 RepID=UPI002781C4CF|nr:hypothetical protein [Bacillus sp. SORGH_AS_0510]MDQ1143827.1 competence protein ComGC [Bacillus sp. SORGH_AS_0510]